MSVGRRSSRAKLGGISGTDLEKKGELDCAFSTRCGVKNTGERPACLQDVENFILHSEGDWLLIRAGPEDLYASVNRPDWVKRRLLN